MIQNVITENPYMLSETSNGYYHILCREFSFILVLRWSSHHHVCVTKRMIYQRCWGYWKLYIFHKVTFLPVPAFCYILCVFHLATVSSFVHNFPVCQTVLLPPLPPRSDGRSWLLGECFLYNHSVACLLVSETQRERENYASLENIKMILSKSN